MKRVVLGALVLALGACSGTGTAAQGGGGSPSQSPDQVVAEVGGRKITLEELDEKWRTVDPGEQARVTQLLYQNRRNVLDQVVGDVLIEDAAKAAKMATEQYLDQELKKRAQAVSDTDIQQFFDSNKDRAQGRTMDQLRGPITEFLTNQRQQQARAQLVDELKTRRAADVRMLLDPPRQTIELALHDPAEGALTAPVTLVEFSDYQ